MRGFRKKDKLAAAAFYTETKGGDRKSETYKINNDNIIIDIPEQGNSLSYTVVRLKRDHPEIFERVKSGEISANAGAIEAGFRRKYTPMETALNAYAKLNDEEKQQFKEIII